MCISFSSFLWEHFGFNQQKFLWPGLHNIIIIIYSVPVTWSTHYYNNNRLGEKLEHDQTVKWLLLHFLYMWSVSGLHAMDGLTVTKWSFNLLYLTAVYSSHLWHQVALSKLQTSSLQYILALHRRTKPVKQIWETQLKSSESSICNYAIRCIVLTWEDSKTR